METLKSATSWPKNFRHELRTVPLSVTRWRPTRAGDFLLIGRDAHFEDVWGEPAESTSTGILLSAQLSTRLPWFSPESVLEAFELAVTRGESLALHDIPLGQPSPHGYGDPSRYWDLTFQPLVAPDGTPFVLVAALDATERHHLQEELFETRAHLQAILSTSSEAIILSNSAGLVCEWNAAAERIFGWTREEMIGRTFPLPSAPEGLEDVRGPLHTVGKKQPLTVTSPRLRKDGSFFQAQVSATILSNARGRFSGILANIRDATEQLVIHAASEALASNLDPVPAFVAFADVLRTTVPFCQLDLFALDGGLLRRMVTTDARGIPFEVEGLFQMKGTSVEALSRAPAPVVVYDTHLRTFAQDRRLEQAGIRSYVTLPLLNDGQVGGALQVSFAEPDGAKPRIVELLKTVSPALAQGLRNYLRFEQQREAAETDALTGLPNRRTFVHFLSQIGVGDAVVLIDLDHFKLINDRLGHRAGDEVLRALARSMRQVVRQADCVSRYGGEEFSMVLAGAGEKGARALLRRLRRVWRGVNQPTTFSAGIAVHDGESAAVTFERADAALYRAKALGRNQTRMARSTGSDARSRILIVEDERTLRLAMTEILEENNYEVVSTPDGTTALEYLRSGGKASLIICGLMMPLMDGWTFNLELKRDPRLAAIPLIVISALDRLEEQVAAISPAAVFRKPPDIPELLTVIGRLLR